MFSVIFEVFPNKENWDDYLDNAAMLRPELERVEGFVDNIRYKSLIREGWILSLSNWRDEKSLVRWRTRWRHHAVQQKGRDEILGATIVARHAGEMIGEISVAMAARMGLGKLASVIHPYPTQAEAMRQCGDAFNRTRLTPTVKKWMGRWLAWQRS